MHKRSDGFREGSTLQYVMVNKLKYEMPQNYYTLKYAHPSCNENVQPQMGNAKQDHVSRHHANKRKLADE